MARDTYRTLRLDPDLVENMDYCVKLSSDNHPVVIVVDGGLGQGKTTKAVQIADYIHGKPFPFKEFMGMGGKEFFKVYDQYKKDRLVIIYDEAGDYSRKGAMTRFNQDMSRIFETFRAFKIIIILVLPRFWWLPSSIFELGVVRMFIHCWGRTATSGRISVWLPDTLGWLTTKAEKLKKSGLPTPLCYGQVSANFRGKFYDLPKARSDELTKFGLEGKEFISQDILLKNEGLISLADMAKKVGLSVPWAQKKIYDLKIKAVKKVKNRNYYNIQALDKLLDARDIGISKK